MCSLIHHVYRQAEQTGSNHFTLLLTSRHDTSGNCHDVYTVDDGLGDVLGDVKKKGTNTGTMEATYWGAFREMGG